MEFNTIVIIYSILVILIILVIYLLVTQKNRQTSENFEVNSTTVNAINNIGLIANTIMMNEVLTIPSTDTIIGGNVSIEKDGILNAVTLNQTLIDLILPQGMIIAYNSNSNSIPDGWVLCDGTTYLGGIQTPDLRNKFIIGNSDPQITGTSNYILRNTGYVIKTQVNINTTTSYVLIYIMKT